MTEVEHKTILIVDKNLGFLAYLCEKLTDLGYTAVPMTDTDRAMPLLQKLNIAHVDALIVNLVLPSSLKLLKLISHRPLKIIAIEEAHITAVPGIKVDGILHKPTGAAKDLTEEWLQTVRRVLAEK